MSCQVRGLFETVASAQDVEHFSTLLQDGPVPASAGLSGAVNPHAAASLLVFHLRDRPEGLLTRALFPRWLAIPNMQGDAQEKECHALVKLLPHDSAALVPPLFPLLRSVAEEHSVFYKDGLNTRIVALSQLFGPLLLRPTKDQEHNMACRTIQTLISNPMLICIPAPPPPVPKIVLPTAAKRSMPPKTVSFRAEKPTITLSASIGKGKENDEEGYESEGTNYNVGPRVFDPDHEQFLEMVASASEDQVARERSAAMRGGPMMKYSSRGKPAAVMFFKLNTEGTSLNWAPVSNPSDLKYGLLLDHVEEVRVGKNAPGQFLGATQESRKELRMVIKIGGGSQLEVEALNAPHLTMWSMTIQHIVMSRAHGSVIVYMCMYVCMVLYVALFILVAWGLSTCIGNQGSRSCCGLCGAYPPQQFFHARITFVSLRSTHKTVFLHLCIVSLCIFIYAHTLIHVHEIHAHIHTSCP